MGHSPNTKKGQFTKIHPPSSSSPIRDICEDSNGNIWAIEQNNGLIKIDAAGNVKELFSRQKFGRKLFYSLLPIDNNNLLVGTTEGLLKVTLDANGEIATVNTISSIPEVGINTITKRKSNNNEYWIATEDNGFFLYQANVNNSKDLADNKLCLTYSIHQETITDIIEEDEGHLLIATWGNGVIKLLFNPMTSTFTESFNFSQSNGLNNNYIRDLMYDREGNYWFATYGGGVSTLLTDFFIYYDLNEIGFKNNKVTSVIHFDKELWMGLENGMLKTDPFCFANHEFYDNYQGIPSDNVTGFFLEEKGTLWVATSQKGLYKLKKGATRFERHVYTNDLIG
jgi:ligand-binding sensor domain-containing protein